MKIIIFGLVIAFFIFKIGYWSKAYATLHDDRGHDIGFVKIDRTSTENVTTNECIDVLHEGNLVHQWKKFENTKNEITYSNFVMGGWVYSVTQKMSTHDYLCNFKLKIISD